MDRFSTYRFCKIIAILFFFTSTLSQADVVINEIHFDPDLKTEWVEFIELYNAGDSSVDLSGWSVRNAVEFQFEAGAEIVAGGYLIVGQDVSAVSSKFSLPRSRIKGPFQGRLANGGERIELRRADGQVEDEVDYQLGFPWPTVGEPVSERNTGTSYSIQLLNPSLDNNLAGSWRSASPTPYKQNSVLTENVPPHIRQVEHKPSQPTSNDDVVITAKVSDSDGMAGVRLLYQEVKPGRYIALDDASYEMQWQQMAMNDSGVDGDVIAGDFIFTVVLPASMQQHRSLMRYRITVEDRLGNALTVPYGDDPQPNFAYFVYDGAPEWTGADRPGQTNEVTYSPELLNSLPIYHLVCSKEEVEDCTWLDRYSGNDYRYQGTLVYDGVVYDHVLMRARGGVWRYAMGKNMWKFNMNRGHSFQARDNYGRKYDFPWNKVNLGANIQQGDYLHRGEQGMFESVGFKLFSMAGIESSNTNFVHFRIIDEENEDGLLNDAHSPMTQGGTQYDGDFWGLYLATEQVDGRFLDEHGLPDGNIYKMEGGSGEIRNQSPLGVADGSDLRGFMQSYRSNSTEDWWRENTDIERYANYRSIVEGIHQYDIASGKNYYFYLNPETNEWFQLPWDLDLTWANNMFGQGDDPFKQAGILRQDGIELDYQNRMRELRDLLYNPDQTGQLIDEFASFIYHPEGESFVDADRAMWDYHWVMSRDAANRGMNNPQKSGQGRFYNISETDDFPGMLKIMKDYVVSQGQRIDTRILDGDQGVPQTPALTALNEGFSLDTLTFETSDFNDANGGSFAAMKWRVAEVEPYSVPWDPADTGAGGPQNGEFIVLFGPMESWNYFRGTTEPSEPRNLWRALDFDDAWRNRQAPIGYGEDFIATELTDMRYNYTTIYMRKMFEVSNLDDIGELSAVVLFDDGFNMWINGVHVAQQHVTEEELPFDALAEHRENTEYVPIELPDPKEYLVEGVNVVAVQVINQYLDRSSDCFFDMGLVAVNANPPEPEPTPNPNPGTEPEPKPVLHGLTEPLKYEINAVWESEELTAFQNQITVPADRIVAGRTYRVRVKMKDSEGKWSHWSQPIQFKAQDAGANQIASDYLRVTEVMYNPPDGSEYEFIELYNSHPTSSVLLGGFSFTEGITYTFPTEAELAPETYLLVALAANEEERNAFRAYYGLGSSIVIFGPYSGKLSNSGEKITLKTTIDGDDLIAFEFSDGRGWPMSADGGGHSLVPAQFTIDSGQDGFLDYGGNWRAGAHIGGSPGTSDPEPIQTFVINEIAAMTEDGNDWIEIYNPYFTIINTADFYLSDDDSNLAKWALPVMDIAPGETVVFDAQSGFNQNGEGFGISSNGESLYLSYLPGQPGDDYVVDSVSFKAQEIDVTWGRDGESPYWVSMAPSRNQINGLSQAAVLIDELMYHPEEVEGQIGDAGEYIELYNQTSQDIVLMNKNGPWRLDGGVDFVFPDDAVVPAEGRLLIVPFDPDNQTEWQAFVTRYEIEITNVIAAGPYVGNLSNQGERIALEKLLDVDPNDGTLSWGIVDEVIYYDRTPWTRDADGTGDSLQRISWGRSGNDPQNWGAGQPNPGKKNTVTDIQNWMMY
ncbi:MAG: lamin tail domain-containing protein [Candidatus Hinthialibacter antarcticus]|nr:lamin tail domain-containing protein [Candidatus Hinthialibacter antarcticus]